MGRPINKIEHFTYGDYITWSDNERWELIDGMAYNMSPAPNRRHQEISGELHLIIGNFLKGKKCKIFTAPFDLRLSEDYRDDFLIENVVQPDLSVFCDEKKLDAKGAIGAPDLAIEILSPSTAKKDTSIKTILYQKFGVKEYWIVDPETETVSVYSILPNGQYNLPKEFSKTEKLKSSSLKGLVVNLKEVF